jgi:hypothetical protein
MSLVLDVQILGEYKNLSKAAKGATSTLGKLGGKFASLGKAAAKVTAGIGIGLGAALASQIRPAIDAASDLNESINAVNVAFGDAANGIVALGENAAKGLGLSKTELFGISVQFSAFAKNIAGDGGDVVGVIDEISKRGSDFASVFNLEVSDALRKFQSGLAGEVEPLRKFGIDLSAAAVKAYALENGIGGATGELTEQEKVLARYELLMKQTDITQGDFVNTSGELANQTRIAKATFTDLQAEIGEAMLPTMQKLAEFVVDELLPAIESFYNDLMNPSGEAQAQIGALGDAWSVFVGTFSSGSSEVKSNDVFKWIGDSAVSVIKVLTNLSTFVQETFEGISKIFAAGFGMGPMSQALRSAGIRQAAGALAEANRVSSLIKFSDERPDFGAGSGEAQRNTNINININRAQVNADDIINDINRVLRTQGSTSLIR